MPIWRLSSGVVSRWSIVACVTATIATDISEAAQRQKQVLVLHGARRDAQIVMVADRELPRMFDAELPDGVDYYSEFIDQGRFGEPDLIRGVRDFIGVKYRGRRFDLIIAIGDGPYEFVADNRDRLFPDVPVVSFTSRAPSGHLANSTGLVAELNLAGTMALAMALQPDVRQAFVISGSAEADGTYDRAARAQLAEFKNRLDISYWAGLPTKELERRLASLPPHSMVYYLVVDRDGMNEHFHPLEYLDRIAAISTAPVYCWVDSAMDHGIVGGSLKDQLAEVSAVGRLALRVLRGERADSIPRTVADLNTPQVDWRQLQRWRISESRIPPTVQIKFKTPSVWSRYKMYIVSALAVLLAQTMLIAGLLVERARRRQAEAHIRDLGSRLLKAQETERSRIARELHDDIGQQVALLTIQLELLTSSRLPDRQMLGTALERSHTIGRSLHSLSHRVHPASLHLVGLVPALHALQHELLGFKMAIAVTHENVPAAVSPDVTLCLFRVAQEAVQNALKHSGAHEVIVHLRGQNDSLFLTVTDSGVGFDVDAVAGKGLGLISMRERLEPMGGTLDIHSKPGRGTRLEIRVPLPLPAFEMECEPATA